LFSVVLVLSVSLLWAQSDQMKEPPIEQGGGSQSSHVGSKSFTVDGYFIVDFTYNYNTSPNEPVSLSISPIGSDPEVHLVDACFNNYALTYYSGAMRYQFDLIVIVEVVTYENCPPDKMCGFTTEKYEYRIRCYERLGGISSSRTLLESTTF